MSIKNKVTRAVARKSLKLSKNSPHIMFVVGIGGVIGAAVLSSKATLKLEETLEAMQNDIEEVKRYPDENTRKDVAYAYAKGGFELTKLYAPALVVGGLSIAALTGSHVQLTRRNTALTVAYAGLHEAYNAYRERVREHVGEDTERNLFHGIKLDKVEGPDGKKHEVKMVDPNGVSAYARFFDEGSTQWTPDPELNLLYVRAAQNWFNDKLQARGHVFLNEVYEHLGLPHTKAGACVGWVVGGDGDNYIDFGIYDLQSNLFVNGWSQSVLLDFNVDGIILDKI